MRSRRGKGMERQLVTEGSLDSSQAVPAYVCDAAESLYERHSAALFRFCLARLRSRSDAEDAVQTTFVRACGALGKGVRPVHEAAWLFKIAHNVCLSHRLAAVRRGRLESTCEFDALDERFAAPVATRDELFGLDAALGRMSERLRRALLLREWQGLSYAEIADTLDTSVAAVETLLFRARRQLARELAPEPARTAVSAVA
jgi:RNA polymerase sigma factor (sigma-70 family)